MRSNQGSFSFMKYVPYACAQSPSATICVPTMHSSSPAMTVCRFHSRPKIGIWVSAMIVISSPSASSAAPGTMNRCVGLWTSRKRRWRQPSRKRESFVVPPRGA